MLMTKANISRTKLLLAIDLELSSLKTENNFRFNSSSTSSIEIVIDPIMIHSSTQLETFPINNVLSNPAGFFFHDRSVSTTEDFNISFVNQLDHKKQLVSEKIRKNSIKEHTIKFNVEIPKEQPKKNALKLKAFKILRNLSSSLKRNKPNMSCNNQSKKKVMIKSRRASLIIDTKQLLIIDEESSSIRNAVAKVIANDNCIVNNIVNSSDSKPRRKHTSKNNNIYVTSDIKKFQQLTSKTGIYEESCSSSNNLCSGGDDCSCNGEKKHYNGNSVKKNTKTHMSLPIKKNKIQFTKMTTDTNGKLYIL